MGELKTIVAKIESDVLRVPEELRGILGPNARLIVGTAAVVAFSAGTSYSDILRSLEMIHDDVQCRLSKEESHHQRRRKKVKRSSAHKRPDHVYDSNR